MPASVEASPQKAARNTKKVRERHKMVMFLHCGAWQNKDIAKVLGYSEGAVSTIVNSTHPELLAIKANAQVLVRDNTLDVMHILRQEALPSVQALIQVRDQDEDFTQKRLAARDILDRAGYSVVRKQINFKADIPIDRLDQTLGQLESANEVEVRRDEWRVTNPEKKEK